MVVNLETFMQVISLIFAAMTFIGVVTSVITEVTKNTKFLDKIPTEIEVLVLSIILSEIMLFAVSEIIHFKVLWYMVVATFILGFFVSFIVMFGWEKLITIIEKCKTPSSLRETYKLTYNEKLDIKELINLNKTKNEEKSESH